MSNKVQFHEFHPEIYPLRLWIAVEPTDDVIHERFEETNGNPLNTGEHEAASAYTYSQVVVHKNDDNYGVLISVLPEMKISDIAHEATHAARVIWNWLGEDYTGREADAYLVGWIADCINQVNTGEFND